MDLTKSLFSKSPGLSFRWTNKKKVSTFSGDRPPRGLNHVLRAEGKALQVRAVVQSVDVSTRMEWGGRLGYPPPRVPHRWCVVANPTKS